MLTEWRKSLNMSKHILKTFRQFVLSATFKALPLRPARLERPEPLRAPIDPAADTWLLEPSRSVADCTRDLTRGMGRLAETLTKLHSVISDVSSQAPLSASNKLDPAFGTIWSDDLLFEGEPLQAISSLDSEMNDGFLFEDAHRRPAREPHNGVEIRASL